MPQDEIPSEERIVKVRDLVRSVCLCCTGSVCFDPSSLGISLWSQRCYFRDVRRMTRLCAVRLDEVVGRALGCESGFRPHRPPEEALAELVGCFSSEFGINILRFAPKDGDDERNKVRCRQMRLAIRALSRRLVGRSEVAVAELRDWASGCLFD